MKIFNCILLLATLCVHLDLSLGLVDGSNITDYISNNFLTRELRSKCRSTGGDEATQKLTNTIPSIGQCIAPVIDIDEFLYDFRNIKADSETATVFKKYCKNMTQVVQCTKNDVKQLVKTCFDEKEGRVVYIALKIIAHVLRHACTDSFIEYLSDKGVSCLVSSAEEVTECVNSKVMQDMQIYSEKYLSIVFDKKECNFLDVQIKCYVSVLKSCDKPKNYKFIEEVFKIIRDIIPCAFKKTSSEFNYKPSY